MHNAILLFICIFRESLCITTPAWFFQWLFELSTFPTIVHWGLGYAIHECLGLAAFLYPYLLST